MTKRRVRQNRTEGVIEHILKKYVEAVDVDLTFEEILTDYYQGEVQVGWMRFDAVTVMKQIDPVWWNLGRDEQLATEFEEGQIISFDNGATHYRTSDIETFIEEYTQQQIAWKEYFLPDQFLLLFINLRFQFLLITLFSTKIVAELCWILLVDKPIRFLQIRPVIICRLHRARRDF